MNIKLLLKQIILGCILAYFLFALVLFFGQQSLIYHPDNQNFEECYGFQEYDKITVNETRAYLKKGQNANIFIYYHGNAGSACGRSFNKDIFEETNASVMFVEYTGYSNDTTKPSQKKILNDVRNIHQFIRSQPYEIVTVYGQSIGSGAASYHTSLGNVDKLILTTPFSTFDDLAQSIYKIYPASIISREKYNNVAWLSNFNGSLIILHGDDDTVIPHHFSQILYDDVPTQNKTYILIENYGHNNIWTSTQFGEELTKAVSPEYVVK